MDLDATGNNNKYKIISVITSVDDRHFVKRQPQKSAHIYTFCDKCI